MRAPKTCWPIAALLCALALPSAKAQAASPEARNPAPNDSKVTLGRTDTLAPRESAIEAALKQIEFHGQLRQETAYRVADSGEFTKIRQQLLLTQSSRLTDSLSIRSTQRVWYDAVYDLTDNYPESAESDQEWELELRDTYLDYSHGALDLRLGKQQIVWGDAVGLFFADVVNAKDLREYVLPDFDLIRIPQWALDLELSLDHTHLEAVWLPVPEFNKLGVRGSEFEFDLPVPSGSSATLTDPSKPPSSFDNSEAGVRLSHLMSGWDMSGFYLYTWDKFPTLFRTITSGVYDFRPQYQRAHVFGGSFSKEIREIVLKGELLIHPHAGLPTLNTNDPDGIVQRTTVDYLLGADYTFFGRIDANIQLLQRIVANHDTLLSGEDKTRTHLSLWLKTGLLDGKLEPEVLLISRLSEEDILLRPKLTTNLTDHLQWKIGADVFRGEPSGIFGRFEDNSRVYTELTYHF